MRKNSKEKIGKWMTMSPSELENKIENSGNHTLLI